MKRLRTLKRLALVVVLVVTTSGCGVKLVYNNADRLARWWVDDYIEMTDEQRDFFDASVADIMYWHRTTQLSVYQLVMIDLASSIEASALDREELLLIADEVENWGVAFNAKATPVALDMLLALSPEQIEYLDRALTKSNRDYEREARREHESRAKEEAKDYRSLLRRFTGRLRPDQRALILEKHLSMAPDAQVILEYRQAWQKKLLAVLTANPVDRSALEDLMVNFDDHYTPEFQQMIDTNEVIYQDLTLELLTSLSSEQRERFGGELREYAELFGELIEEAPEVAPPKPKPLPRFGAAP